MNLLYFLLLLLPFSCYSEEGIVTVEKRNVIHKFHKMDGGFADWFTEHEFKNWENDTFDAFEKVKNPHTVAIDIGAWIGTTAIWLSSNFAYVVAIEADKKSLVYLEKNLESSGCKNVLICKEAISHDGKPAIFGPRRCRGDVLNNSTSCIKPMEEANDSINNYTVPTLTLHGIIDKYVNEKKITKPITFIKCDIEGGEEGILTEVLDYAYNNKCSVWMSFHYAWWSKKNIDQFRPLFNKFHTDCPSEDVCSYIKDNPFASILFTA